MVRAGVVTSRQRREFVRDGFVVVPRVVDRRLIDNALRSINHRLDAARFGPELVSEAESFALMTESPALSLAGDLVGRPLELPATPQIALRHPVAPGTEPDSPAAHLDGVPSAANGLPLDGTLHGYTLLACVLLSDLPAAGHGNFTVWPGTHTAVADWLADRGLAADDHDEFTRDCGRLASATSEPVAITGRAGDVILAHGLLLHCAGAHAGPHIRYAAFFRLTMPDHAALGDRAYTDPWAGWRLDSASRRRRRPSREGAGAAPTDTT